MHEVASVRCDTAVNDAAGLCQAVGFEDTGVVGYGQMDGPAGAVSGDS